MGSNASMSLPRLNLDRTLAWSIGALIAVFLLFEFTPLDLWVQDHLYDSERRSWWVDGRNEIGRALFYTGPKVLIIAFGVFLVGIACVPSRLRPKLPPWLRSRRRVILTVLPLGLVPAVIGGIKATTNVFCPSEIRRYGGDVPYVRVLETYAAGDKPLRRGRCFPGGHASGGYALFAVAGLALYRRGQLVAIAIGLGVGSLMGGYQMAKGAHYLSHTLITALVAWSISAIFFKLSAFEDEYEESLERLRALNRPAKANAPGGTDTV